MNPFNQKMSEKLGGFPIGVWVPYYRSDFSVDYLKEIRSCGVNFVPSISSGEEERKAIAAAGLKVLLNDDRVTYCNVTGIGRLKEWLSEYTQDENVIGIFVWDEPSPAMMRICGAINETVQSICPETFGFINLHPEYSDREKQRDGKTYEEYLDFFVKTCAPKVICYDNYPFYKDGFHADSFFSNLSDIAACARKNGLPFWAFIQSASFGENIKPSAAQMRFQVFATLAYGGQGILYFTYKEVVHEKGFGAGLLDREGKKTDLYFCAKEINADVSKMGNLLLSLKHTGVAGTGKYRRFSTTESPCEGKDLFVGLFSGENGDYALAVNGDFENETVITRGGKKYMLAAGGGTLIKL